MNESSELGLVWINNRPAPTYQGEKVWLVQSCNQRDRLYRKPCSLEFHPETIRIVEAEPFYGVTGL